jgi:hypothetical protein
MAETMVAPAQPAQQAAFTAQQNTQQAPASGPADVNMELLAAALQGSPMKQAAPQAQQSQQSQQAPPNQDEFIKALEGVSNVPQWNDEAKRLFKETFNAEDPIAFREQYSRVANEAEEFKKSVADAEGIKAALKRIEESNPAFHAAIIEELDGRDGLKYISNLPNANILGKKASDLSDETLFRTYMGDKFTEDEWKAWKTNDYDDVSFTKDVIQAKIEALRPAAEFMHQQRYEDHRKSLQEKEQALAQQREMYSKLTADNITQAQADPYARIYLNQETIEAFRSGTLTKGLLTQDDGVTPHPNMLVALTKAKHFDEAVKRAYEAGLAKGEQRGLQQGTAQLPIPRPGGRAVSPADEQKGDPYLETLAAAIRTR